MIINLLNMWNLKKYFLFYPDIILYLYNSIYFCLNMREEYLKKKIDWKVVPLFSVHCRKWFIFASKSSLMTEFYISKLTKDPNKKPCLIFLNFFLVSEISSFRILLLYFRLFTQKCIENSQISFDRKTILREWFTVF